MKYIILGIIQGLTEFFPVSSKGHLVIAERLMGINDAQLLLILACHLGTLLSMFLYFYKDIIGLFKRIGLIGHIALVSVITFAVAKAGDKFFESLFASKSVVIAAWFATGVILIIAGKFQNGKRNINSLDIRDSLLLGFMQASALIPGISRSGMTISALLFRKIDKDAAFKFSFLAGMPAIAGAFVLKVKDAGAIPSQMWKDMAIAGLVSFIVGLFALAALKAVMDKAKIHYFGYYCIVAAILTFIFLR